MAKPWPQCLVLAGSALVVQLSAVAAAGGGVFGLAYAGADLATRFQFVIMAVLGAALVSFFAGSKVAWDPAVLEQSWTTDADTPFWVVFAIFFPAVTGFTQGVSMLGDLKNPARSLPVGTFLAVGLSTIVYVAAMFALLASVPLGQLVGDYDSMKRVAVVPWLVDAGVLSATLSSALASFLGAPRVLQALASDRLFERLTFFAAGHGPTGNPRRAVVLTGIIALRPRRPERARGAGIDVLSRLLWPAQLRDLCRSRWRKSIVSTQISLLLMRVPAWQVLAGAASLC